MKATHLLQTPQSRMPETVQGMLKKYSTEQRYNIVRVAMAYVTVAGIRTFLDGFKDGQINKSQWLVGLDDCITQPGALDLLRSFSHAEVKVASLQRKSLRFHPKLCYVGDSERTETGFLMLGSANLTKTALRGNVEGVAFFHPEDRADYSGIMNLWKSVWKIGHAPSKSEIASYEQCYNKTRSLYRKLERAQVKQITTKPKNLLVLDTDDAELDPGLATTCWIECGNVTAMGRELEFKAEQGIFFGLDPSGGEPKELQFELSNKQIVPLRMKYQENHMWRLQMNNTVPEVEVGLRPRLENGSLGRSEYVAVFTRTTKKNLFAMRFLRLQGREFKRLVEQSKSKGTFGKTSARVYGWC